MTPLHKPLTLHLKDGKYFIDSYGMEEPENLLQDLTQSSSSGFIINPAHTEWLASKQAHEVSTESVDAIKKELICEDWKNLKENYPVNIDELHDKLEIVDGEWEKQYHPNEKYSGQKLQKQMIRLKPVEQELPEPIGKFIIDNIPEDRVLYLADGAYYHYSDVCKLLKLKQK
jgi:hypothetical protein